MISTYLKRGGFAAMILAALAIVAAVIWGSESATARGLDDRGATAMAFVVQKHRDASGADGAPVHEVTYLYQSVAADGARRTHRVEHRVPQGIYDGLSVGEQVEIRYLPESPAVAAVYPGEHADGRTFLDILALVAAAAAAIATLIGLQAARRAPAPVPQLA